VCIGCLSKDLRGVGCARRPQTNQKKAAVKILEWKEPNTEQWKAYEREVSILREL
jgi:hypothetical protein